MYELSSDSDDDCYDKFPLQLQRLKTKHALNNLNGVSANSRTGQDSDVILVLDANNVAARTLTPIESDTPLEGVITRSRRAKRNYPDTQLAPEFPEAPSKRGKRGRGSQTSTTASLAPRRRGRRGRWSRNVTQCETITLTTPSPNRNRGRRRNIQQIPWNSHSYTTYSIGNTHDYTDASECLQLFSNINITTPEVQELTETTDLDESFENEELSVKIYWQHSQVFKFNIRRLQKLTQIFDFFVNKEGVSRERLLFTYNDKQTNNKVLRPDDTPDSINYNIAKFIDGGIVNKELNLGLDKCLIVSPHQKGFTLKFQFQNKKKPLEISVGKDEKLQKAMVKCSEDLETPISTLVFKFDGEVVQGNRTPNDLGMESGDCLDVKIINVNK